MTKQLIGKIYWVLDDFAYIGEVKYTKDSTTHTVARISNAIIEDYMIKFFVCPYKITEGDLYSYNVNLLINESATKYNGSFTKADEPSYTGEVYAELYSNLKRYLLNGRWIENENIYTFWAVFEKE